MIMDLVQLAQFLTVRRKVEESNGLQLTIKPTKIIWMGCRKYVKNNLAPEFRQELKYIVVIRLELYLAMQSFNMFSTN